ncbi:tyrosine-type recombinase/integrase [Alkalicoccus saliphilus]|uniref:Site-specific integrase n=1 Tax=Alkalicoccus saliphilus TaxID=200989 RepID=A0A2T4U2N4_9BACI|nr:site-specific integrase [Alkalicoccus saliphilus]PTL37654.1 site-specific integrase [Alkalicoccus saliphilus]
MARIYKKKTKTGFSWGYVVYAGTDPITNKEKRHYKQGFKTQKDAKLAAALAERQLNQDDFIQPSRISFQELSTDWEKHYLAQKAKESSLRARKIALKHMIAHFENVPIQKINKKAYQDAIDKLAASFSENYISSIHSSAHMVFEYAVELKLLKENPAKKAKLPKRKVTLEELENRNSIEEKYMEKAELEEFLTATKEHGLDGDLLTFTLLSYSGLRIGELLALKWSEMDFQQQTLNIIRTYYNPTNNKKGFKLQTPKTKSSIRLITIDTLLIDLLKRHKEEQNKMKKQNAPFYQDQGFIFATNEGYPKTIKHMAIRMQRLLKKTTIQKHLTLHSFRHTHTSLLAQAEVSLPEIMERLGHDDENTTKKIYLHVTKEMKKEASTKFSNLMKDLSENLHD